MWNKPLPIGDLLHITQHALIDSKSFAKLVGAHILHFLSILTTAGGYAILSSETFHLVNC
jgi:hypothetical protein